MKKLIVFFLLLTNIFCLAQKKTILEVATEFVNDYQSQIPNNRNPDLLKNLVGKIISDENDPDEKFSFINSKYYFFRIYGKRRLMTYQFRIVQNIPLLILLNNYNDRVEGYIMATSTGKFIFKDEDNDNFVPYKIVGSLDFDTDLDIEDHEVEEFNYYNPKVSLYSRNNKIGIKYEDKKIIKNECDSLQIKSDFVGCYNSANIDLYNIIGESLAKNLKSTYFYSEKYFQIINPKNEMKFVDALGKEHKLSDVRRSFMGNDEIPTTGVHYKIIDSFIELNTSYIDKKNDSTREILKNELNEIPLPKTLKNAKFVNNETSLWAENYWYDVAFYKPLKPSFVIASKNKKYGVWDLEEDKIIIPFKYQMIIPKDSYLLLEHKGLFTFYPNIGLKPKYKSLDFYQEYYARFEYPDGRKGWVDREGKEFFD